MAKTTYVQHTGPSVRPSVMTIFEQVKNQVEFHCFANLRTKWVDPLYTELCLIISEVIAMNPDTAIKINGSFINTYMVQEIFYQLSNDHLRRVFENFHDVPCRIYNKKAYLRTSLYNAFFELEAHFVNIDQ